MAVGEPSKRVSKLTIGFLKVIPMLLASVTLLNQVLAFFYIELDILGYIGSVSLLPLIFLYLSSYCFKFCSYHRMFLHYVVICNILNMVDFYIGIPISAISLFLINVIVAGIFLFIILYLYKRDVKCYKRIIAKNSR